MKLQKRVLTVLHKVLHGVFLAAEGFPLHLELALPLLDVSLYAPQEFVGNAQRLDHFLLQAVMLAVDLIDLVEQLPVTPELGFHREDEFVPMFTYPCRLELFDCFTYLRRPRAKLALQLGCEKLKIGFFGTPGGKHLLHGLTDVFLHQIGLFDMRIVIEPYSKSS